MDPVIKANARLEFEDGLKMGVHPVGYWYSCGGCQLQTTLGVRVGFLGSVVVVVVDSFATLPFL